MEVLTIATKKLRKRRGRDKVACAFGHYLGHRSHCKAGKNASQRYYRVRQEQYLKRLKRLERELTGKEFSSAPSEAGIIPPDGYRN
ncbi:MAG: hypothetical protein K6U12_05710 [Armatimonadetes bacterium]|nr:hypothetical protein [Armatimonadota bacterium]